MYTDFKLNIGYVPTRRIGNFPDPAYAIAAEKQVRKRFLEIFEKIGNIEFVDVNEVVEDGILVEPMDSEKVADYLMNRKVDALLLPHVNFGSEEAAALVARTLKVPVLLWGPRDMTFPERMTDSQCGMFATSMALSRCHVPFTYLENCALDSRALDKGLDRFVRAASVAKAYRNMRIGQISVRPKNFLSVRYNENEIFEKFGMEVVAIDTVELQQTYDTCMKEFGHEIDARIKENQAAADYSQMDPDRLRRITAVELTLEHIARTYGCTALASQCFELFEPMMDLWPCQAFGNLTQRGLPCACETDVMGAISSSLLQAAARGDSPTFITDLTVRHPEDDNAELLWHCGVFPSSLAKDGRGNMRGMCIGEYELKPGKLTAVRFGGLDGEYRLFADEMDTTEGPGTDSTYVWAKVANWPKWEEKFIYGPYIHHISCAYGSYSDVLHEACKYMNGIKPDSIEA